MRPKPPRECNTLADVRTEIDRIDRDIIRAIGERRQYVIAAAAFKTTPTEVAAPERLTAMLQMRRRWAEEEGISPDVIEKLYRDLTAIHVSLMAFGAIINSGNERDRHNERCFERYYVMAGSSE